MKCRHCSKEILISQYGLRHFCSESCKQEYRRKYLAMAKRQQRTVEAQNRVNSKGGYVNTYPPDVNNINPHEKPVCEGENQGHGLDYDSFGGKQWYELAKSKCCNFEARKTEGYCVTLFEPYYRFHRKCSECRLGMALVTAR
ncbi:MAG: hypothetical protein ACK415_11675 [Thermodesulfovibrionales bacterium]